MREKKERAGVRVKIVVWKECRLGFHVTVDHSEDVSITQMTR
jgi:hypothetical protein